MSLDEISYGTYHSNSSEYSQSIKIDNSLINSCHLISQNRFPILSPNVPFIHLPRLQKSNSWSFIKNHKSSDYFTSISYLNDALHASYRIPLTYSHRISCSIDNNYNDQRKKDNQQINLKNIKRVIFGNYFKLNQKYPYTKQHTQLNNKSRKNRSIPIKKSHYISQRQCILKENQHTFKNPSINSISSQHTIPLSNTSIKNKTNSHLNIISHTRFGKSMLALYFQNYRFISPIDNNKKEQFLKLLKPSTIYQIKSKKNISKK